MNQNYENKIRALGFAKICGIDEVGRGAWAGPLVAAGVVFDPSVEIEGLNDSKQVKPEKRNALAQIIKAKAIAWTIQEIDVATIDLIGVGKANELVIQKIVAELQPDYALIDKAWAYVDVPHELIIKGDSKVFSIAAASIIAKVYRDDIMERLEEEYPGYNFKGNKGYGTKDHQEGLGKLGHCGVHRTSYKPILQAKLSGVDRLTKKC